GLERDLLRVVRLDPVELGVDLGLVLADDHVVVGRAGDLGEVSAHVLAVLGEDRGLVREALGVARDVRVLPPPGHEPQRALLPAARDPQRDAAGLQGARLDDRAVDREDLPGERRLAGLPRLLHDLHALGERGDARPDLGEAVAVRAPLVLVPAGADAHLDAPARDDVHGRGDLREVGRVAVAHARAHLAET